MHRKYNSIKLKFQLLNFHRASPDFMNRSLAMVAKGFVESWYHTSVLHSRRRENVSYIDSTAQKIIACLAPSNKSAGLKTTRS